MSDERPQTEIRQALDAVADRIQVPDDLAMKTLAAAREQESPSPRQRWRAWRDARWARGRVAGYPRWAYGLGAAASIALLFVVGSAVTGGLEFGSPDTAAGSPGAVSLGDPADSKSAVMPDGRAMSLDGFDDGSAFAPAAGSGASGASTSAELDAEVADEAALGTAPFPPSGNVDGPPALIRSADLEVEVAKGDFESSRRKAEDVARSHGGVVTGFQTTELPDGRLAYGTLTLRIPQARLGDALTELRRLGTLMRMDSTGFDVSGQLADYDARIRSAERQEARLLELLDEAKTVSETVQIQSRLDGVRREIESLQAQKAGVQGQVDFSTVRLTLTESGTPRGDEPGGRLAQAWDRAVDVAFTVVAGVLVLAGFVLPLIALILVVWLLLRLARRARGTSL